MRARVARCASRAISPARSACRRARSVWWRARSAATTGLATPSTPSSRWSPGPPSGCAVLSSGPASGGRHSSPTTIRAISCRRWSSLSMPRGTSSPPAASLSGRPVLSNTPPTYPYRAAGRPEVLFVMERLIDLAARRHGFDRVELRRRNLVPARAMPYRNPLGLLYDSGDYAAAQDRAVALADWAGFEARRAEARRRGRYRGIGLANYIELNTGAPRERAEITVRPEGRIDVVLGTLSAGQGHETSFAQL